MGRVGEDGDGAGHVTTDELSDDEKHRHEGHGQQLPHSCLVLLLLLFFSLCEVDRRLDGSRGAHRVIYDLVRLSTFH